MNEQTVAESKTRTQNSRVEYITPTTNVTQAPDKSYVLYVEMPGVTKDSVNIAVEGNELTVSGTRTYPVINGETIHREIRRGEFRRTFELDATIDTTRISARVDQGVLKVELPLAEAVKPRKILVEA